MRRVSGVSLNHGLQRPFQTTDFEISAMNFNLFPVIAASAISASVVLPAHAQVEISERKSSTLSYTQKYLQQSANFYAALDHKAPLP